MIQKNRLVIGLISSLFFVNLGGLFLHLRVHPISAHSYNYIPFIAGLIGVLVIPILFLFKKTLFSAYLLNGMITIIGIITMTHLSIHYWPKDWSVTTIFLGTLFPDVMICIGAFLLGYIIFEISATTSVNIDQQHRTGRIYRYPNLGFWGAHMITLSVVYTLGHILWK